jgi:phosphate transport system permease protein
MVLGTVLVSAGAMALAAPLGLLNAVAIHFYLPRGVGEMLRRVVELMAGIPSVVYGFWGLVVIVPLIGKIEPPGTSLLAGALILALMILPTMALVADIAFAGLPPEIIQGTAALGLSRSGEIWGVFVPSVRGSLATGAMLQAGRALGETMVVIMVCGNIVRVPRSVFDPVRTLTANIALEMAYALGDHRASLFFSGLMLMLAVSAIVMIASRIGREVGRAWIS